MSEIQRWKQPVGHPSDYSLVSASLSVKWWIAYKLAYHAQRTMQVVMLCLLMIT
jgi:hypothetical protein